MKNNNNGTNHSSTSEVRSCEFESRLDKVAESYGCDTKDAAQQIINKIQNTPWIKHYAAAVHDLDRDASGKLKEPHIHIVLELQYPVKMKAVSDALGMPEQTIQKIKQKKLHGKKWVADVGGALSYLTHRNAKEKHQYPDSIVIASPDWNWKEVRAKSETFQQNSDLDKILMQIADGTINESNLAKMIDPRFYILYKKDIDAAFAYRRFVESQEHDRDTIVIFIHGEKGTGKTTLAKHFCESQGLSYFISGGNNDPFDSYSGEQAVILDDVRPWTFESEEWLKILDNNTSSLVRSRYHNKKVNAKFIILTSTLSLQRFGQQFWREDNKQLFRRIKINIELTRKSVEFYEWKQEKEKYVLFDGGRNPVTERYGTSDLNEKEKSDIVSTFLEGASNADKNRIEGIDTDDLPF